MLDSLPIAVGGEGGADVQHVRDPDGRDGVPLQLVQTRNRTEAASAPLGSHRRRRLGMIMTMTEHTCVLLQDVPSGR